MFFPLLGNRLLLLIAAVAFHWLLESQDENIEHIRNSETLRFETSPLALIFWHHVMPLHLPQSIHLPSLSWLFLNEIQPFTWYPWLICKGLYKAAACLKKKTPEGRYCCKSGIWEHLSVNLTFLDLRDTIILQKIFL